MNNRNFRARVVQVVLIIRNGQEGIDHRDYRSDACRSEPGPDKLRAIGKHQQHAVFNISSKLAQGVAGLVRQSCYCSIGPLSIFKVQADFIFPSFLDVVVEEVVGHVEPVRKRRIQSETLCFLLRLRLEDSF